MTDIAFGRPLRLRKIEEGSSGLKSDSGHEINPGDYFLEDELGHRFTLDEISSTDLYGDIEVSDTGDLALVEGAAQDEQLIFCRARTSRPDWPHHPWVGGDLEELKGLPNIPATAEKAVRRITETLVRDGRFDQRDLEVIPVPTGPSTLTFFVFLGQGDDALAVPIQADLGG